MIDWLTREISCWIMERDGNCLLSSALDRPELTCIQNPPEYWNLPAVSIGVRHAAESDGTSTKNGCGVGGGVQLRLWFWLGRSEYEIQSKVGSYWPMVRLSELLECTLRVWIERIVIAPIALTTPDKPNSANNPPKKYWHRQTCWVMTSIFSFLLVLTLNWL